MSEGAADRLRLVRSKRTHLPLMAGPLQEGLLPTSPVVDGIVGHAARRWTSAISGAWSITGDAQSQPGSTSALEIRSASAVVAMR